MTSEPKKVDRRKFIYAGLGAVALIAIGAAAYVAMNPPVVTQTVTTSTTVPTTSVVTTTVPTTSIVTTTISTTTSTAAPEELVFWRTTPLTPAGEEAWTTAIEDFKKANPDVPIKVESIAEFPLADKANSMFALGQVPFDLAWTTITFQAITWGVRGYIEDLGQLGFFDWVNSNYPGDFLEAARMKTPGPGGAKGDFLLTSGFVVGLNHVRSDWIKDVGYKPEDVAGPFDKFESVLYALRDYLKPKGANPLIFQVGTSSPGDGQSQVHNMISIFQGDWLVHTDASVHIEKDAVAKAFETIYKWWKDGIVNKGMVTATDFDNNQLFQAEKGAMTPNPLSIWKWIVANKPDWVNPPGNKLLLEPWPPLSPVNGKRCAVVSNRAFVISKNIPEKKKQMALKFLKFFYTKENYEKWWSKVAGDYMDAPVYKHMIESPPYTTDVYMKAVADHLKVAIPEPNSIRPSFGAMMTDMIPGQAYLRVHTEAATPAEAAEWYLSQVNAYIEKYEGA